MKTEDQIQRAHDLLWGIVMGETEPVGDPNTMLALRATLDCLCWVLEHDHNPTFADNLRKLETVLAGRGIILTPRTPTS